MEDHETNHDTQGHPRAKTSRHELLRPARLSVFIDFFTFTLWARPLVPATDSIPLLYQAIRLGESRCLPRLPRRTIPE